MHKLPYILLLPRAAANHSRSTPPTTAASEVSLRPVKWTVVGGSSPREIVSGRTVPLTLQAEIAKGWHIYSLTQKPGGPIPLRIELAGAAAVVVRGIIKAPQPKQAVPNDLGLEAHAALGA